MVSIKILFWSLVFCFNLLFYAEARAQLVINNQIAPEQLVRNLLLGSGVEVFNITYRLAPGSFGKFQDYPRILGADSGVVLTNGQTFNIPGPNRYPPNNTGSDNNREGDPDLDLFLGNPMYRTEDASVIEFDFRATSDTLRFKYIFASEEYPEFAPTPANPSGSPFNDVFGFFLSGPGITGKKNIALIPQTAIPVRINTINQLQNSQYFRRNDRPGDPAFRHLDYNGYTAVLLAEYYPLQPCQVYHIKLAIADVGDGSYDSGVFLEAKSFQSSAAAFSFVEGGSLKGGKRFIQEGCEAGSFRLQRNTALGIRQAFKLRIAGTAILGQDYAISPALPDSLIFTPGQQNRSFQITPLFREGNQGVRYIVFETSSSLCFFQTLRDTLWLDDTPPLNVRLPAAIPLCAGSNITLTATATGGTGRYSYQWGGNRTGNVQNFSIHRDTLIRVVVRDACPGVPPARDSVWLRIRQPNPNSLALQISALPRDTTICSGSALKFEPIVTGGTGQYLYSWNGAPPQSNPVWQTSLTQPQEITLSVSDGCTSAIRRINVQIAQPLRIRPPQDTLVCMGATLTLRPQLLSPGRQPLFRWQTSEGEKIGEALLITPRADFLYTLQATDLCQTTPQTFSFWVRLPAPLSLNLSASDTLLCREQSFTLSAQAGGGLEPIRIRWFQNGSLLPDNAFRLSSAVNWSSSTYTAKIEDFCGISLERNINVRSYDPLSIADLTPDTTVCQGRSLPLVIRAGSGSGSYTYQWNPGNYLASEILVTPSQTTLYTVTLSDNCSSLTRSVHVTVKPASRLTAGQDTLICKGRTVVLRASVSPPQPAPAIEWTWENNRQVGAVLEVAPLVSQVYTAHYFDGCDPTPQTQTVRVNVYAPLTLAAGPDTAICPGSSLTLYARAAGGKPPYVYNWRPAPPSADSLLVVNPMSNQTFTVAVWDGCGTGQQQNVKVNVYSRLELTTYPERDTSICPQTEISLRAYPRGGSGAYQFLWQGALGNSSSLRVTPTSEASYTLIVADACASIQKVFNLQVWANPDFKVNRDTAICKGSSILLKAEPLTANPPDNYQYAWQLPDQTWRSGASLTVTPNVSGVYTLNVTGLCIASSLERKVRVDILPAPSLLGALHDTVLCAGKSLTLNVSAMGGGGAPYLYRWQDSNGQTVSNRPQANFTPTLTERYTVIANDRCNQSSEPLSFEVKVIPRNLSVEGLRNPAICPGQSLVLRPIVSGGSGSYQYFWNGSLTPGAPTWEVAPQASAQYTVRVTDGCQDTSITLEVSVTPLPALQVSNDTLICFGSAVQLRAQTVPPSASFTYLWRWGARQYFGATLNDTPPEDTEYTVEVSGGCIQAPLIRKVRVRLRQPLGVLTSADTTICKGGRAVLRAVGSGGIASNYQWEWRNSGGQLVGQTSTLQVIQNQNERYTVTLRDGGCSKPDASASVEVAVAPQNLKLQVLPDTLLKVCPNRNFAIRLKAQNSWGEPKYYFEGRVIDTLFFYQTPQNVTLAFEVRDKCVTRRQNAYIQTLPLPVVSLPAETTLCRGQAVALQPLVAFDSGDLDYHWFWQGTQYQGRSITLTPNWEGQLKLAVSGGCLPDTLYEHMAIQFYPRLQLQTIPDTSICPGRSVQLWAQTTGGHPDATFFQWYDEAGNFLANGRRLTVAPAARSRYTVKASNLCESLEKTISIDIGGVSPPLSWLALSPESTVCKNQEVRLWARAKQGAGNYTYTWRAPNMPPRIVSDFLIRINATTTFYVSAYDGCSSIDTFIIARLYPELSLRTQTDTVICPGAAATLWAQADGGDGNYSYQWLPAQAGGNSASITVRPRQNTTYYVTLTDGCNDTTLIKPIVVRLTPPLRLTTLPDTTVCPETELTFAAWASGGLAPYAWQWKQSNDQILAHQPSFTLRIENSLDVEARVTDGCGAQKSALVKVTAWEKSKRLTLAYLTPDTLICKGQPVTLQARAAQAQGNVTFTWSAAGNSHIGNQWTQTPSITTAYYLRAQDACTVQDTGTVVAIYSLPQLLVRDTTICRGASVVLQAHTTGGKAPVSINWKWEDFHSTGNQFRISPEENAEIEVTAGDACGFSHTQIVKVRVRRPLSVKIEPIDTICPGQSITLRALAEGGSGRYHYEWYNKNGFVQDGRQWTFVPSQAETILVQVTDDCGSIPAIDTLALPYYAPALPLTITNLPSDTLLCPNLSLTLSPGAEGGLGVYRWFWRPLQSANRVIVLQPNQTGIYTVRLEDKCAATEKNINITLARYLTLLLPSDTLLCRGEALLLAPLWEGGKAPLQWRWQLGAETSTATHLTVPPNYEGEVRLSVTDACGKQEEKRIRIRRFLPAAFAPLKDTAVCKGAILTLQPTATAPNQELQLHYQWFKEDSLVAETTTLTLRITQDQTLRLRISDHCGAFWEDTLRLTVRNKNQKPLQLSVSPPDSILCPMQKIPITINVTGGNPPYSYRWQYPAQDTSWHFFPLVVGPITQEERYFFKASDICGAEGITSKTFRTPSPLQAQDSDTTLCPGEKLRLKAIAAGGKPPLVYQWQGLGGAEPWVAPENDRVYQGKVIDACLTEQKVLAQIKIARPLLLRDTTFRVCRGFGQWIEMKPTGGAPPFQWFWLKGNDTLSKDALYWVAARENETLQLRVTSRCPASIAASEVKVEVVAPVEFDFRVEPSVFCNGDTVEVQFIGVPPQGRPIWDFTTATALKGSDYGPYQLVIPEQGEWVTLKLFLTTEDCFYDTLIKTLRIRSLPDASFLLPASRCWQDTSFIFRPQQIHADYKYRWQMGQAAVPAEFNGSITPPVFFTRPGKHTLTLRVQDEYCAASASQVFEVWEYPELLPDTLKLCSLSAHAIRARPFHSHWSYLWYREPTTSFPFFNGAELSMARISADTTFWVKAVNEKSCTSLTLTPIFISPYPLQEMRIQRLATEFAFEHQPIQFRAEQDTAIAQYIWEFEGENRSVRGTTAYHTFAQNGTYTVTLKGFDNKGCPALPNTVKITIDSRSQIITPNAFTPNGDGNNDDFYIYHQGLLDFEIQIFDRYGVQLYQSSDPNFRWKGVAKNGEPLPEGVYVFTLTAKGKDGKGFVQKGTITLIR